MQCQGNEQGDKISVPVPVPSPYKKCEVLPVINVRVNDRLCTALMDLVYSCSLMNNSECLAWSEKNVNVLIAKELSQGISTIELKIYDLNLVKVTVLVVESKLLGFDLILGMNIQKVRWNLNNQLRQAVFLQWN